MSDRNIARIPGTPQADWVAKLIEDAANRLIIRLGAWTLAIVSIATAVLIAVQD